MKTIYIIRLHHLSIGGAESYLSRLYDSLTLKGFKCKILSSSNKKELKSPIFISSFLRPLFFSKKVCTLNKEGSVFFSLERISCADIYRAGDGVHKEWLRIKRENYGFFKKLFSYLKPLDYVVLGLEKECFRNSKKIIANSHLVKNEILKNYNLAPEKIAVIHNGFMPEPFCKKTSKRELLDKEGIAADKKIILFVGNGFFRKGLERFIDILYLLKLDYSAIIIGKDRRSNHYKAKAEGLKNIHFLGERRDVDIFYKASDIFLFPTLYEPFSNACLEAANYENVVFTTDKNGFNEVVEDRRFLIEDNLKTASMIDALLSDEDMLSAEQIKFANIAKKCSLESNIKKTIEVIESI